MTNVFSLSRVRNFLFMAAGLIAGLLLMATLGNGGVRADGHVTGFEEVRTNAVEQNFVPGQSRSPTNVWIYGSGFEPDTEVFTLIADGNGVLTDITVPAESRRDGGGSVFPLVANEHGAWATSWRIGRFTRNGVGGEGMFSLIVVDTGFNTLATTPLALCNNAGDRDPEVVDESGNVTQEAEAVPDYCSA